MRSLYYFSLILACLIFYSIAVSADLTIRSNNPIDEDELSPATKTLDKSTIQPWQTEKLQEIASKYSTAVSILRSQIQRAESILKDEQSKDQLDPYEIQRWSQVLYHLKEQKEQVRIAYEQQVLEILSTRQIVELGQVSEIKAIKIKD
ncbi:MAG: hypothetical protein SFT81_05085 [Candidatus Caenarcaniphilales bacterium]|nr:hypothetical protein [Candidatus Caenarcaniphilales bacterium]